MNTIVKLVDPPLERACRTCGYLLPLDQFGADGHGGLTLDCRPCYRAKRRALIHEAEVVGTRRCWRCKVEKPMTAFHKCKRNKSGRLNHCKSCNDEINQARVRNPDRNREYARRGRYDLSPEAFDALLESQGGKCAICRDEVSPSGRRTTIDHDHRTGRVRGVLCSKCNSGLGLFGDQASLLEQAARYLREREYEN